MRSMIVMLIFMATIRTTSASSVQVPGVALHAFGRMAANIVAHP